MTESKKSLTGSLISFFDSNMDSNTITILNANKSYKTTYIVYHNMKQAIVVRKDVSMEKGKLCVQVAHASVSAALLAKKKTPAEFEKWVLFGQKKIVVKVDSIKELHELKKKAVSYKIPNELIRDAGLTQLKPGTVTALGIGPAKDEEIDKLIKDLKLL